MVTILQEVNKGRRRLLWGVVSTVGAGLTIAALAQAEPAIAATNKIAQLRDRKKSIILAKSPSRYNQGSTQSILQGQQGSVQGTPTPDPTETALQKRLLLDQIKQLETPPPSQPNWLQTNTLPLVGYTLTLGGLSFGAWQYFRNLRIDREKRDEDRFQTIVSGLGSDSIATRTAAANLLRIFLDPKLKESYRRYYEQIFDLAVTHLRLREVKKDDPNFEPDQFYKEIIKIFIQSRQCVVEKLREKEILDLKSFTESNIHDYIKSNFYEIRQKFLDATYVHLEGTDLKDADLQYLYMRGAFLTKINLRGANLAYADLKDANLTSAVLGIADLSNVNLIYAINHADVTALRIDLDLRFTNLTGANLTGTKLNGTDLTNANLILANLTSAELGGANLRGADLRGAKLTLAKPEWTSSLEDTKMWGVRGLFDEQINECKAKGAIFDPPTTTPDNIGETK